MLVQLVQEDQTMNFVVRRHFKVKVSGQGDETQKNVTHYHFQGWEDWQLPTGDSRSALSSLVEAAADYVSDNAAKQGQERRRLLVHCRAGIGRTGTTIAILNSIIAIKE